MKCEHAREFLLLPEEGYQALPFWRRWSLERHWRRCPACSAERRTLERMVALLRETPWPSAPEGLWEQVEARLPRLQEGGKPREAPPLRWAWALAGLGLLALLLWEGTRFLSSKSPPPEMVQAAQQEEREAVYYHTWLVSTHPLNASPAWDMVSPWALSVSPSEAGP